MQPNELQLQQMDSPLNQIITEQKPAQRKKNTRSPHQAWAMSRADPKPIDMLILKGIIEHILQPSEPIT